MTPYTEEDILNYLMEKKKEVVDLVTRLKLELDLTKKR